LADTGCVNIIVEAADTEGATASDTFTICVDGYVVGVGDVNMESFEVNMYPNPSKGGVTIDLGKMSSEVEICVMDITGRMILNKKYEDTNSIQLDLSGTVSGTYLVHIQQDSQIQTRKLILNKK